MTTQPNPTAPPGAECEAPEEAADTPTPDVLPETQAVIDAMANVERARNNPAANQRARQRRRGSVRESIWALDEAVAAYSKAARDSVRDKPKT